MGIPTFFPLNTAVNALETMQQAQSVVGNNIANANTTGYAQETPVIVEATEYPPVGQFNVGGQIGEGSVVKEVVRQTSAYIDQQNRTNQGQAQMYTALSNGLTQIQGILNEPSSNGLQNAMDQFFSSWQVLSSDPSSTAARQAVISQAQAMAQTFGTTTNQLESLQSSLTDQVYGSADFTSSSTAVGGEFGELNQYAQQIATLNQQIVQVEQTGESPNSLLDQRGVFLDKMSNLANISYSESTDASDHGAITVSLGGIQIVPASGAATALTVADVSTLVTNGTITSGTIAGNLQTIQETGSLLSQLNTFLTTLSTSVNRIQTSGYGLNGTTQGPELFQMSGNGVPTTDSAGNVVLSLNSSFAPTTSSNMPNTIAPTLIAASTESNQPGNNTNALAMVALQSDTSAYSGGTFDEGLEQMVSSVGVEANSVKSSLQTANALAQQSSNMQQSISGVDTNQQAALMVQYQNSFNAAAQFISVYNQMLQTLISTVS
ncbi:MAG: flagellar hook-associated protein FlgK [Acidibacillus sp.]|nr:flagellar hook-associated protein FlgK [Acidibacillus sp.]